MGPVGFSSSCKPRYYPIITYYVIMLLCYNVYLLSRRGYNNKNCIKYLICIIFYIYLIMFYTDYVCIMYEVPFKR